MEERASARCADLPGFALLQVTTLLSGVNSKAAAESAQQLAALQQQVTQQGAAIKELKAQAADKARIDEQVRR
jgi:hypothetical protein